MPKQKKTMRKVIDAKCDSTGKITHVLIEQNQRFTSIKTAIQMAQNHQLLNVHPVRPKAREPYLRSNPDSLKTNNLDQMAS